MKKFTIIIGIVGSLVTIFVFVTGIPSMDILFNGEKENEKNELAQNEVEKSSEEELDTQEKEESKSDFAYIKDKIYKIIKIGNQIWLAENLNYDIEGSTCYVHNNNTYCNEYGRLYTWEAAKKASEEISGWHLPSDDEWKILEQNLGMNENEINKRGIRGRDERIGDKLKKGGQSGFEGKLGGYQPCGIWCDRFGDFSEIGKRTNFWTSTPVKRIGSAELDYIVTRSLEHNVSSSNRYDHHFRFSKNSVRLVKDY